MYGIKISYSWGDEEDHLYGKFPTKETAFEGACVMAGKEAYVQNEEFLPENTCQIYFDAAKFTVDLHYDYDDQWCYYRIEKYLPGREEPQKEIAASDELSFTK